MPIYYFLCWGLSIDLKSANRHVSRNSRREGNVHGKRKVLSHDVSNTKTKGKDEVAGKEARRQLIRQDSSSGNIYHGILICGKVYCEVPKIRKNKA